MVLACTLGLVPAQATQTHLTGLVLAVDPAKNTAVVRPDAAASMPPMTMSFVLAPGRARTLHPGERIEATLDDTKTPAMLRAIRVTGSQLVTSPSAAPLDAGIIRRVHFVQTGDAVPTTPFIDQAGKPFSFAQLRGQTVVLAFIYTRCRDPRMCPLISAKFHALQSALGKGAFHLVEVTLDPAYDKPVVLRAYAKQFDADTSRWTFLTGDPETVLNFAAQFGVTAFADQRVGLIHPERTVVIDPLGTIRQMIDEVAWQPAEIVAAARSYSHLSSNPLERLNLWLSAQAVALCGNSVAGFSGGLDLLVVLAIFGGFGWLAYRIARRLFLQGA